MDRTARIIVGLVLDRSIGWGQPWADIDAEQCQTVCGGQLSYVRKVIAQLIDEKVLRRQRIKGRYMYAVERPAEGDLSAVGTCRVCGHKGEIDLDPTWRPVPHDYFWHVPRACDGAMLYCMGIITEATMRWDAIRRWPIVVPTKLILQDFIAGGYGRSTVIVALDKLEKLGFIGVDAVSGQRSSYWVKPENFRNGTPRPARKLTSRSGRNTDPDIPMEEDPDADRDAEFEPESEDSGEASRGRQQPAGLVEGKAKIGNDESPQASETATEGRPVEFFSAPVGKCRRCGSYGPVTLTSQASDDLGGGAFPGSPPSPGDEARSRKRAGPSTEQKPPQTQALVPANMAELRAEENFELFWQLFVVAGKSLNRVDRTRAAKEFQRYPEAIQGDIILWAIGQMQSAWKNEQYTPMPYNALKSQGWTRVAAERIIPDVQPKTKTDLAWDLYEARCRERGEEPLA